MNRIRSAPGRVLALSAAVATFLGGLAGLAAIAPPAAAATTFSYVNMGDSLSSGEGTYQPYDNGTDAISNRCHRSPNSYSAQFVSMSINSYSRMNVACSGAGVYEIRGIDDPNTGGIRDNGEQPQDIALSSGTRLITISIGINDLNLIGFASYCYGQNGGPVGQPAEDSCFRNIPKLADYQNRLAALPGQLDSVYTDIRQQAPNATVAVLTYPQIYPTTYTGSCETFPLPGGPNWLVTSQPMLDTAHSLLSTLNTTVATEVAKYPNFILVDEANALSGHDVCQSSASARWANQINGVNVLGQGGDNESLHPTIAGYQAMAKVLARRLDAGHLSATNDSVDQNIVNAYKNDGGLAGFGYPADNGGGPYVHYWSSPGANVQDFSSGSFGPAIIVDGSKGTFFINYGFRDAYISGGYAKTCLAPTDNAYASGGGTRQDFLNCYMTWTSSGGVVVHGPNPVTCTDYGGSTMTGPNACVGFHTAAPPGKPASGNVWYSGKGVGLYGQEIWTYANGTTATSTAIYNLSGLDTVHAWQLQAYIPNNYSDASHAHYHYCSPGGGCVDGHVNQNNYTNQWAPIGSVCTTDGTATVTLADDGGDVYPVIVGADAIRAVRTGIAC
jgi:lysophospholipase L1-like esterase